MYITRHLEHVVEKASNTFPVVMVTGPRQVGKTTMLEKLAQENRTYVSLDSPITREMAVNDPELFLQRFKPPVLIDEFQYAKGLLPFIKAHVDRHKKNGDFWLTGSQMFHMMEGVSESLAGRVAVIPMLGLSNSEMEGAPNSVFKGDAQNWMDRLESRSFQNLETVYAHIFRGSMPRLYGETDVDRDLYYGSYLDTYIQRDIRDLTQVADELAFLRFMTSCAARTAQQISYTELARDAGVTAPTAKRWLSLLRTSGIVMLVDPYFNNTLKRIVKAPKMYFLDTGLAAYLTRWDSAATLEVSAMNGAFFETYVVSEIVKSYYNAGKRPPIFYYRDTDQKEIDVIIEAGNTLCPFEIKKTAHPKKDAIKQFKLLEKTKKEIGPGGIICMTNTVLPMDSRNYALPVWII